MSFLSDCCPPLLPFRLWSNHSVRGVGIVVSEIGVGTGIVDGVTTVGPDVASTLVIIASLMVVHSVPGLQSIDPVMVMEGMEDIDVSGS